MHRRWRRDGAEAALTLDTVTFVGNARIEVWARVFSSFASAMIDYVKEEDSIFTSLYYDTKQQSPCQHLR